MGELIPVLLVGFLLSTIGCKNPEVEIPEYDGIFASYPNEWIIYTVTNPLPLGCLYSWTVTNGQTTLFYT